MSGKPAAVAAILEKYKSLKPLLGEASCTKAIGDVVLDCLQFLHEEANQLELLSMVQGKQYFAFEGRDSKKRISRPVNQALFLTDIKIIMELLGAIVEPKAG